METFWSDVRYGFRMMVKSPAMILAAMVSLGLGIGANTTIFSVINAVLLRPLPVERPEELVTVMTTDARHLIGPHESSYLDYTYYRDQNHVFQGLAAHKNVPVSLTSTGFTELVLGDLVTGNFFSLLGVVPAMGRGFRPEEDQLPGASPVVILGYGLWQRRFGGDPDIIGKTIALNGHSFTIIGVAPKGFEGILIGLHEDLWVPMMMQAQIDPGPDLLNDREIHWLYITGRLKPNVSAATAQAEMTTLAGQLASSFSDADKGLGAVLARKNSERLFPGLQSVATIFLIILMSVVGLVLLIACANVANLLLARAAGRRREIAIRLAMGASRKRLVRQLLTEGALLAILGGAFGLLVAFWSNGFIMAVKLPTPVRIGLDLGLDVRVLVFTAVTSLVTGIVFGLAPSLQASNPDLVSALKGEAPASKLQRRFRLRNVLVTGQVAVSLLLLIGAGLFLRSLQRAQVISPGFDSQRLLLLTVNLGLQGYDEAKANAFYKQLVDRVQPLPGVESVSLMNNIPLGADRQQTDAVIEGPGRAAGDPGVGTDFNVVGLNYFQTMNIPLLQGRDFSVQNTKETPGVTIINEAMARRYWPGENPLGKRFRVGGTSGRFVDVIGVARDGKYRSLGEPPTPFLYLPLQQSYRSAMTLTVRTAADPAALVNSVRAEAQALDATLPVADIKTMSEHLQLSLLPARVVALLLAIFGLLALILASVGLYGVVAYGVSQRTHEIGLRMALGARTTDVLKLILVHGMRLTLIGMAIGLIGALVFGRIVSSLLYGVSPADPITFVGVPLLLCGVALVASYFPARRATLVDPLIALRYE